MRLISNAVKSLTKFEKLLWVCSIIGIIFLFLINDHKEYLTLLASIIGATALIFVSKGNVLGQVLTVLFSILYGIISYTFNYYGEMITYLGMTTPIAIASIITWVRNPFKGNRSEVKVAVLKLREYILMSVLGVIVMIGFYFILRYLDTNYLILSTVSVFTSFIASYLTLRRSEFYALMYALNDLVLITLWILATLYDISYMPMIFCFVIFLINDIYGFINWSKTKRRQMHS